MSGRRRLPQTITREQFDAIAAVPSRDAPTGIRNAAALVLMYDCGLRVEEVCQLSPHDRVLTGPSAHTVRVRRGKGGRDRQNLAVPTSSWALLERWARARELVADERGWSKTRRQRAPFICTLAGGKVNQRYLRKMLARCCERAGVYRGDGKPVNPHMLRHSYATRLLTNGVPIHEVQRAMGHEWISTTMIYLHVDDAGMASRVRRALEGEAA
jgi:integrase/recombinase XerD